MLGKVFTSVFCIFVAAFMFGVNQIGGSILESAVMNLSEIGAPSAERMAAYLDFPLVVGAPLQTAFVLFILAFQLAITWSNKYHTKIKLHPNSLDGENTSIVYISWFSLYFQRCS